MKMKTSALYVQTSLLSHLIAFLWNIFVVYAIYGLCRLVYLFENWDVLGESFLQLDAFEILKGSLLFDTSAIIYTNIPYALLMLLPLFCRDNNLWQRCARWVYFLCNAICVVMNIADAAYFRYTGRRTTAGIFSEFSNEKNIGGIIGVEILKHWYLFVVGLFLLFALWSLYMQPKGKLVLKKRESRIVYYLLNGFVFLAFIPLAVAGMRGGFTTAVRPITISNANQFVKRPAEAAVVLNTPFSLIRTIGKNVFADPEFYSSKQLDEIYSPIHKPQPKHEFKKRNVVVLIVESFGREYIGAYNKHLDGGAYKGYTPFVDSLISKSLTFEYTFANGRRSIEAMPSVLSSIPSFKEPFILTPASMNEVSGLAGELAHKGYYSAFFHGAENGSMGFQALAKTTGYTDYFGRTEYNQDKRFGGDDDFDGTWAVWDEPFLQFFALKMSEFKQPFLTTVFTASSHHPYVIPDEYKNVYKEEGGNVIHKCIRYTDNAFRKFFETARKQPWYKNTIFVFTADHTNLADHAEYKTDFGGYSVPIFIFDPSGDIQPERRNCIAQQADIMPSVLGYLGYDRPFIAFGQDLFSTKDADTWAVSCPNGVYQYVKGDYVIQMTDEGTLKVVFNYKKDPLMKRNLVGRNLPEIKAMERELKAVIQSYMQRMINDKLIWER